MRQAGEIENDGVLRGVFDSRGNRPADIKQYGVGYFFLRPGARTHFQTGELRRVHFRHPDFDSRSSGFFVDGYHAAQRRVPVDQREGALAQGGLGAHNRLQHKIGNENGSECHRNPAERPRGWRNSSPFSGPSSRAVYAG